MLLLREVGHLPTAPSWDIYYIGIKVEKLSSKGGETFNSHITVLYFTARYIRYNASRLGLGALC